MIIVMRPHAAESEIDGVTALIASLSLSAHVSRGAEHTIVGVIGAPNDKETLLAQFAQLDGVESVVPISKSYKLVSREARPERTIVRVNDRVSFGGTKLAICAGPCSVESREQIETTAAAVPERTSCAAARSSRVRRHTRSRASAKKDCACCAIARTGTGLPS
jgi:3-deoxy-7-phosphoheptulonate synthase